MDYDVKIDPDTDLNDEWEQLHQSSDPEPPPTDTPNNTRPDYGAMAEYLRVRPDEDIPEPPVCLSITQNGQKAVFGTLGNFSVLIGKAKSRKTFTVSFAVAAALQKDLVLDCVAGHFEDHNRNVLYFDTEQGRYHVLKVVKRICRLAKQKTPDNLLVFALRSLPTEQRLGFIEHMIYQTPNVGLVIIDGIRDTVQDINDNAEATERTGQLLRWTEQCNIHILTVIHMNKSNDMIRGTIGTELQNKAETVVSVALDPTDKNISIVKAESCRDKEFEPFAFSINEQGLPVLIADWQPEQPHGNRNRNKANETPPGPRTVTPGQLTKDEHEIILKRAFTDVTPGRYAETYHRIKAAGEYFGHKFGDSRAKEFVTYYIDRGLLRKDKQVYVLNLEPAEPTDSTGEQSSLV